jgi:hypothetical protein
MARPTKYNDHVATSLLRIIVEDGGRECAARFSGIGIRTLTRWLTLGRAGDPRFARFAEMFEAAEGTAWTRRRLSRAKIEAARSRERWAAFRLRRKAARLAAGRISAEK